MRNPTTNEPLVKIGPGGDYVRNIRPRPIPWISYLAGTALLITLGLISVHHPAAVAALFVGVIITLFLGR